jgi:hypothetical protein
VNELGGSRTPRIGAKLRNLGLVTGVVALVGAAAFGVLGVRGSAAHPAPPAPSAAATPATVYVSGDGVVTLT